MTSPTGPAPYPCPHCPKRFGKPAKLDRHLLDAHHGSLRLSPDRSDGRAAIPAHVSHLLSVAVEESNAVFQHSRVAACPRCISHNAKPFRNVRDLAQHLLAKHYDEDEMTDNAHTTVQNKEQVMPLSEISCKRKRNDPPVQDTDTSTPEPKRPRVNIAPKKSPTTSTTPKQPTNKTSPQVKKPITQKVKSAISSPTPRRASAPAMTNPPVTPNKPPKPSTTPAAASSCAPATHAHASLIASAAVRLPAHAIAISAPIDFFAFGGFAANSSKSYYRLTER